MGENNGNPGEFGWIGQIRQQFNGLVPPGMEGIGDDCAVVPIGDGQSLVVTTDLLIENVHFVPDKISAVDLGYKSLAVNLSDVAAMGAEPIGSFLSIGLPKGTGSDWRDAFLSGYKALSTEFRVPLLGGDTTAAEKLTVNVTALGKIPDACIKRRSGAKPGDLICVTGNLGDSAAGLRFVLNGNTGTPDEKALIRAHCRPKPYVEAGKWLAQQEAVHAMMDVSDGIASDLVHVLEESGVSARVELSHLPMSGALKNACTRNGWNPEELAVSGGEDYVLLFAVDPQAFEALNNNYKVLFGADLTAIGQIIEGCPVVSWERNGNPVEANWNGFSHF